jgi:DNA-binding XRE family transcriptional regulator
VTGYAISFTGASGAGGSFAVTVFRQPDGLRVEVRDEGADSQPAVRAQAEMTEDGRGLGIVHLIADRWGQSGSRSGRTVFFGLRWPPPTPASPLPATARRAPLRRPGRRTTSGGVPVSSTTDRSARWTTMLNGTRLRQLRLQHGLSQEALADRPGISLTTVARLERRPCGPARCRTLARLAAALGEPPAATELSPATGTATDTRP